MRQEGGEEKDMPVSHVLWKYSNQSAVMRKKRLRSSLLFLPFVPLLGDFKT